MLNFFWETTVPVQHYIKCSEMKELTDQKMSQYSLNFNYHYFRRETIISHSNPHLNPSLPFAWNVNWMGSGDGVHVYVCVHIHTKEEKLVPRDFL